jgi:hypothetical protein
MKKSDRISAFVESLTDPTENLAFDPCYLGYFKCFNQQQYYEAHDVLEHLWLANQADGQKDPNYAFFKGLIQLAGAFVHLKKQFLRPTHPKDASRMRPASRLFLLAQKNLSPYGPVHLSLNVESICRFCDERAKAIMDADYKINPWNPENPPILELRH